MPPLLHPLLHLRLLPPVQEEEERELEEVEDLLEYYLQRAANTQSEAERLLAGARDLEESIGVSLSARRFEVGRVWGMGQELGEWGPRGVRAFVARESERRCSRHRGGNPRVSHPPAPPHCAAAAQRRSVLPGVLLLRCRFFAQASSTSPLMHTGQPAGAAAVHRQLRGRAGCHGGGHLRHEPALHAGDERGRLLGHHRHDRAGLVLGGWPRGWLPPGPP